MLPQRAKVALAWPSKIGVAIKPRPAWAGWLGVALLGLLSACQSQAPIQRQQFYVFGTLVEISIAGVEQARADAAINHLAQGFQRFHDNWHAWQGDGELQAINQALAAGLSAPLHDPLLRDLLLKAQDLAQRSQHLFNPAIGQLSAVWGFHNDDFALGALPNSAEIARLVAAQPSLQAVHIETAQIRSDNPAVQLDVGAIAKGYAVDWAVAELRTLGITNAIINAGGNLRAIGQHGARPWRIGIRHPNGTGVLAALDIDGDESVFTSGNYERYREIDGHRYSHILDPRTGWPVEDMVAVSVIHDHGTVADVASTALSVAGLQHWQAIAAKLGIRHVMLIDRQGTVYLTPPMQARLEFIATPTVVLLPAVDE